MVASCITLVQYFPTLIKKAPNACEWLCEINVVPVSFAGFHSQLLFFMDNFHHCITITVHIACSFIATKNPLSKHIKDQ